jgi:hypothetical protein
MLEKEGRFYLSLKVLNLTNIIDKDSKLSMLVDFKKILLKLTLGRHLQSLIISDDLEKRLLIKNHLTRYHNLLKLKLLWSLNEYDYEYQLREIDRRLYLTRKDKQMIKTFLNLLHHNKINNSTLDKNLSESVYWYMMALLYYDQEEDFQKIKEIINECNNYKTIPIVEQIEFFINSKYTLDSDSFIRYIRNITTNFESNYNGYYIMSILFDNASNYYENKNFYKAANLIRKYGKEMLLKLKRMT